MNAMAIDEAKRMSTPTRPDAPTVNHGGVRCLEAEAEQATSSSEEKT